MQTLTSRQLKTICFLMIFFAVVRYSVFATANENNHAGWLSFFLPGAVYFFVFYAFSKILAFDRSTFLSVARKAVGRIPADMLMVVYAVFMLVVSASSMAHVNFSLKASEYSFTTSSLIFGTAIVSISIFLIAGLNKLARMSEIIVGLVLAAFVIWAVLLIPFVEINNLTPVSSLDTAPVLKSSTKLLGVWGLGSFGLMLGGQVGNRDGLKKLPLTLTLYTAGLCLASFIVCVGAFGAPLIDRFSFSTSLTLKVIELSPILQRLDAIIILLWFMADFFMVAMSMALAVVLLGEVFGFADNKPVIIAAAALVYCASASMLKSSHVFWVFFDRLLLPACAFMGIFVPLFIFAAAKIRKQI